MEQSILQIAGQIAGIGGLSLGVLLIIFRQVIAKNIFVSLTKEHSYKLLRLAIILAWSISAFGIMAWAYSVSTPTGATKKYIVVTILINKDDKPVLVSEEPMQSSIIDIVQSKNLEDAFKKYIEHGMRYTFVNSGTKVEILESDTDKIEYKNIPPAFRVNSYKVRILEGEYMGHEAWVQSSFLKTTKELQ
jgi:hypothetical protein